MSTDLLNRYHESEGVIPYRDFVKTTFAYYHSINMGTICSLMDLNHLTIGFVGEYIELNNELEKHEEIKQNLNSEHEAPLYNENDLAKAYRAAEKELGDMCYYVQMLANHISVSLPVVNPLFNEGESRAVENFVDAVKRMVYYRHENVDLFMPIIDLWSQVNYIAKSVFNQPIEYFILQNKEKLMKRYSSGSFSPEEAAAKKDAQETS